MEPFNIVVGANLLFEDGPRSYISQQTIARKILLTAKLSKMLLSLRIRSKVNSVQNSIDI